MYACHLPWFNIQKHPNAFHVHTYMWSWLFICWLSVAAAELLTYFFYSAHNAFHRATCTRPAAEHKEKSLVCINKHQVSNNPQNPTTTKNTTQIKRSEAAYTELSHGEQRKAQNMQEYCSLFSFPNRVEKLWRFWNKCRRKQELTRKKMYLLGARW